MTKRIEICEVIKCYHLIEVDDELDIEEIVQAANHNSSRCDSGCEAIKDQLDKLKDTYGFDYEIKEKHCGVEIESIYVIGEVD